MTKKKKYVLIVTVYVALLVIAVTGGFFIARNNLERNMVTALHVDHSELTMETGTENVLTASVEPVTAKAGTLVWESSDPKVALVSEEGTVKALTAGSTVITVRTEDGAFEARCNVTVTPRVVAAGEAVLEYVSEDGKNTCTLTFDLATKTVVLEAITAEIYVTTYETVFTVENGQLVIENVEDEKAEMYPDLIAVFGSFLPTEFVGTATHTVEGTTLTVQLIYPPDPPMDPSLLGVFTMTEEFLELLGIQ